MLTRRALLKTIPAAGLAMTLPYVHAAPVGVDVDDLLDKLKTVVVTAVSMIPEVGGILGAIVSMLWPEPTRDVWGEIRRQVEAMIDEKIDGAVFNLLQAKLTGLGDALKLYLHAVAAQDRDTIRMQFIATNTQFVAAAPEFQNPAYAWTLLPLFAIFTQFHMALLRDCVLHGKDWGWSAASFADVANEATRTTQAYLAHIDRVTATQRAELAKRAPSSPGQHQTAIYDYWQPFEQRLTLLVDDFRVLLVYLDPVAHPEATRAFPFKDVYSRAYGTADDWDRTCAQWAANGVATPFSAPLAGFSAIDVELFNRTPRVVNVRYPAGKGPKQWSGQRTDATGIIADPLGGVEKYTVEFPAPAPDKRFNVEKAVVTSGSIPLALTLVLDDGSRKTLWNRTDLPGAPTEEVAVPGRMLTTLNMWSRSRFYDRDLGCLILGFSRDTRYVPPHAREALYIGAVVQPDTGPAFLPHGISSTLQTRRDAFWRAIELRSRR